MSGRSLNFLVAGGFDPNEPGTLDRPTEQLVDFGRALGEEIVAQGHNLMTGCQTELDKVVADGAGDRLMGADEDDAERIVSYVRRGQTPVHNRGSILQSDLPDWDIGGLEPNPPEVVRYADAVVLIGGFLGTHKAANWARLTRKPLLPFASFGGMAKEVYGVETTRFDEVYAELVSRLEYDQVLKSLKTDWASLARDTVTLAEKLVTTRNVFVVMSFEETPEFRDLYASIQRVCAKFDYIAQRVDESNMFKRILPEMLRQMRQSAFVIADVTAAKANVYYELGFADGVGKDVVLVAKKGTELPFDIHDVPVVFWDSFTDLEADLERRLQEISSWQGKS